MVAVAGGEPVPGVGHTVSQGLSRRVVLGASGLGISTFVLPGMASAASFGGTTLSVTQPGLLTVSAADASDGVHDVVLTVTLTDGGQPFTDPVRVDLAVRDDQGVVAATTIEGSAGSDAAKLSTTGTVTFDLGFPSFADYQLTVTTTPAAVSHPSGLALVYTHSTVPDAPTSVGGTAGDAEIALSWTAPGYDGGATITGYQTRYSSDSGSTWSTWSATGSTATTATVTGLSNGTGYVFQVRAVNGNGNGTASTTSATITPVGTPDAPTGVSGTPGDGQVVLSWSAPADDGGTSITGYEVRRSTDSGSTWTAWTATGSATPGTTITSLTNGTGYVFQVRAVNAVGESDPSATSDEATPSGLPGAPSDLSATPGDARATLNWSAPADTGGSDLDGYATRHSTDGGSTWTTWSATGSTATTSTITGLANGNAYVFQVRASNGNGWGPASSNSASITPTPSTGYSASFVSGQRPSTEAVNRWATFRASLTGTYTSFTMSSSLGQSVTVSHGTLVQQLADGLRNATATSVTIDGVVWGVGLGCRSGGGAAVEFYSGAACSCAANSVLRPDINNNNWGGIGTTCGAASQTLSLEFS